MKKNILNQYESKIDEDLETINKKLKFIEEKELRNREQEQEEAEFIEENRDVVQELNFNNQELLGNVNEQ